MVLVPVDQMSRLNVASQMEAAGPMKQVTEYNRGMMAALSDQTLPADIKAKQFGHEYARYQGFKRSELGPPLQLSIRDEPTDPKLAASELNNAAQNPPDAPLAVEDVSTLNLSDDFILKTVPKNKKMAAQLLLHYLKTNPQIEWTRNGQLVLDGHSFEETNIIDIVNNLTRDLRQDLDLPTTEVTRALIKAQVPQRAFGNRHLKTIFLTRPMAATPRTQLQKKPQASVSAKPVPTKTSRQRERMAHLTKHRASPVTLRPKRQNMYMSLYDE